SQRRARLASLTGIAATLIFYEAPHRIKETLREARETLGNRQCVLARELTKLHEEFRRGSLAEVYAALEHTEVRGEIVLLIGPRVAGDDEAADQEPTQGIAAEIAALINNEGLDQKAALKRVARARGLSKSEAYRRLMAERAAEESAPHDVE